MSSLNQIPRRIILGPGPSSAHPRVLKALSSPVMGYLDPDYFSIIEEVESLLKDTFKTSQRAFAIAGSGSAGMEAGFSSLVEEGDKILICENFSEDLPQSHVESRKMVSGKNYLRFG